jgi:Protein of unknown function (DUF4058)
MPLLDHFHPPLSRTHPWRAFHGAWAAAMARLLNAGVLPSGYYAVPFLDREGPVEIDVATVEDQGSAVATTHKSGDVVWAPAAPQLSIAVEWPSIDEIRVEVFKDAGDPRLAAAIELASPRNKDRPRAREAFASKCANHLRHGRGLVVVDVVTTRRADLHADLLAALGADPEDPVPRPLAAIAYKSIVADHGGGKLLAWPAELQIGQPLPTLPLWLAGDLSVPLNLESSHTAACEDIRISSWPRLA